MALQLCPHQGMAEKVAETFGLIVPEYDAIREEHAGVRVLIDLHKTDKASAIRTLKSIISRLKT